MTIYPIPTGTRDILPEELAELHELTEGLRKIFAKHGFEEVATPTMENEWVVEHGDERAAGASYRLFDENGNVLVLRSDMTVPIARMVATRFAGVEPPLRFSCIGRTFRTVRPLRGQFRESLQAGVELIGLPGVEGDTEVLTLLCEALAQAGLKDFKVGLGDARLYRSLLADLEVPDEQVLYELVTRDFVGLEREVRALGLDGETTELLISLPKLRGGPEVLEQAVTSSGGEQFGQALESLEQCHKLLEKKGVGERVIFDLGLVRDLGYYTGVVFEVYDPAVGITLGGGGRYDNLLGRFGRDLPAVGFDISIERLHMAAVDLRQS